MWFIAILALFLIFKEEANKNILTPQQRDKVLEYKPLVDAQKRLQDDLWSGRIFKKK